MTSGVIDGLCPRVESEGKIMSTAVKTQDNQIVATRYRSSTGVRVQMEVTEREWAAWRDTMVAEDARER